MWQVNLKGVPTFLGDSEQQWKLVHGNTLRRFGAHELYRILHANMSHSGVIEHGDDIFRLLQDDMHVTTGHYGTLYIKPTIYTYVIVKEDDSLRFSETGTNFIIDFASKHAQHSDRAEAVWYAGEFHLRPRVGWESIGSGGDSRWELVLDNDSGTYKPESNGLFKLQRLLQFNFPGLIVITLPRNNDELQRSKAACRAYASRHHIAIKDEPRRHAYRSDTVYTI